MGLQEKKKNPNHTDVVCLGRNLLQPSIMTFASYDYSLTQHKALTQIVKKLQGTVKEAINQKEKGINAQLSIFTDEEFEEDSETLRIRIPMKDFGFQADKYSRLRRALLDMSTIPISVPYFDNSGQLWEEIGSLCTVRIPVKKHIDVVDILIKKKTARYLLDIKKMGYTSFYEDVVMLSTKQYTPRIYLILSAFSKRQNNVRLKMKDLRTQLKLEHKYNIFRDFIKNVLNPAQNELLDLYNKGISDFYFEYEKEYSNEQIKKGEPAFILFKFHIKKDVVEEKRIQEQTILYRHQVYDLLRSRTFMLDEPIAHALSQKVNLDNHISVLNKLVELNQLYTSPKCEIINRKAYTYTALNSLFEEM